MLRTHTCNELRSEHIEQTVTLTGWVDTVRDHGGVLFVDLRDHYGVTQIVFSDDKMLSGISKETVVLIEGAVTERDAETVNPKIETGTVEVRATKIEVLGPCQLALPFEIDSSTATREDVRLKYRYLDLRNKHIHDNIVLRSKILSYLRGQMESLGFLEIFYILVADHNDGNIGDADLVFLYQSEKQIKGALKLIKPVGKLFCHNSSVIFSLKS